MNLKIPIHRQQQKGKAKRYRVSEERGSDGQDRKGQPQAATAPAKRTQVGLQIGQRSDQEEHCPLAIEETRDPRGGLHPQRVKGPPPRREERGEYLPLAKACLAAADKDPEDM